MDPVTQGLLGSAVSQALTQRKLRGQAAAIGCVAGIVPDLDIFIRSKLASPLLGIYYHRHFSHSLFFIPFGGLIVALIFLLLFPSLRSKWKWVIFAAMLGYATHGILDAFTSYGTLLYWPFSLTRVHWDLISIIDPVYTGVLLVGVVLSIGFRTGRYALFSLLLSGCYLSFNAYLHHEALNTQKELRVKRGGHSHRGRVMPLIFHPFLWRSIYTDNKTIYLDNIEVNFRTPNVSSPVINVPLFQQKSLPSFVKKSTTLMHDYHVFDWFSDGYLTAVTYDPLVLADARYIFNTQHPSALWGIRFVKNKLYIEPQRHLRLPNNMRSIHKD